MRTRIVVFNLLMLLLSVLILERVFRLLPVSYPPYLLPVDADQPILRFQPNVPYRYSRDWNFTIVTRKRSKNYGFINEHDYDTADDSPLLVVIGDSYVEGQQVDMGRTAAEVLHRSLGNAGRVYSIGLSGASLSQYLASAQYARDTFRPDAMAFFIVANDFDESLLKYKWEPRLHYFREHDGKLVLERIDYQSSTSERALRRSAFVHYLVLNLRGQNVLAMLLRPRAVDPDDYLGNVPRQVSDERVHDSRRAVDEFLAQLPERSGLRPASILFVQDGMRPALYSGEGPARAEGSYFDQMRRYFSVEARSRGYDVIDMQPRFIREHHGQRARFEFETDAHWNDLGHALVADEIGRSAVFKGLFDE